ncbi:MAG TPA: PEP-CTERM sorting domain-containing protein [Gemmataceae bacterium]|nr:PEP-CTERM sorting domain-containing protein [Gemmataceae bacterium]
MRQSLATSATAFAALLVSCIDVHADSIPWAYSASTLTISSSTSSKSSITFSGASGVASGNSGIIIYSLKTNSSATGAAPDSFSNVPFDLALSLTDIKSTGNPGATSTGTVHFSGLFNATNVTSRSSLPGKTTWSLVLGNHSPTEAFITLGSSDDWRTYGIQVGSGSGSGFTSPGQPDGAPGSIQAIVTIQEEGGPVGAGSSPPPSNTPEPTTFILAALGLPLAVLLRRRMS